MERLQKLGVPLSQVVLLAGAGAAYRYYPEELRRNWRWAVASVTLYETLVVLFVFSRVVLNFIKELWKEEFKKDALKVTAMWLRAVPGRLAPGFARRYNKQVIFDQEVFNVRGLGLINTFTLKLDQVFVDLKISSSGNPNRPNRDPIAAKALAEARGVWDFIRASKDTSGDAIALAVIGPPGCGKTTLLQHVAVTLAANRQRRHRVPAYTPLLLLLREHANAICETPSVSLGSLAQQAFSGDRYPHLNVPPDWFERRLRDGRCMVLLDGLDEVARADRRKAITEWVDRQLLNYPRCRFVITSRPQGYTDAPLRRAHLVEVQPFNGEQVRRFIGNWYLANEIVSGGNVVNEGVRRRARREADDLLKRLADPKAAALSALTVNPLLLTMIAMVHRYRGALPGSRIELYREICEVLLGRWRQAKGEPEDSLTADQKRFVLMPLAARMMQREKREIPFADALAVTKPLLRRVGVTGEAAHNFLHELQASSGLVLEREAGRWGFAHLTFQEYLTAAYWLAEDKRPEDWGRLVGNAWWHETLRLYAAQGDATPVLQACLDSNGVPALTLAAEIMEEGAREIREDVRTAAEARIVAALDSEDEGLRRLAVEVQLSRRLSPTRSNSMRKADDLCEVDSKFITCAEYQIFIDEMLGLGSYHQPYHWQELRYPPGQAAAPVCGVSYEDAMAFCEWVRRRQGGDLTYRLPTREEVTRHPSEPTDVGPWCDDGSLALSELREGEVRQLLGRLSVPDIPLRNTLIFRDIHVPIDKRIYGVLAGLTVDAAKVIYYATDRHTIREISVSDVTDNLRRAEYLSEEQSGPDKFSVDLSTASIFYNSAALELEESNRKHRDDELAGLLEKSLLAHPSAPAEAQQELLRLSADVKAAIKEDRAAASARAGALMKEIQHGLESERERQLERWREYEQHAGLTETLETELRRGMALKKVTVDGSDDYLWGIEAAQSEAAGRVVINQRRTVEMLSDYVRRAGSRDMLRAAEELQSWFENAAKLFHAPSSWEPDADIREGISLLNKLCREMEKEYRQGEAASSEYESVLTGALEVARDIALGRARPLAYLSAFDSVIESTLIRVLIRGYAELPAFHFLHVAYELASARAFGRKLFLMLASEYGPPDADVIALIREFSDRVAREVEHESAADCMRRFEHLLVYQSPQWKIINLIEALDSVARAVDMGEWPQAYRRYAARLLEYTYESMGNLVNHRPSWWERLWPLPLRRRNNVEVAREELADLYWWLRIVMARTEGHLPAWEGIRLARERTNV